MNEHTPDLTKYGNKSYVRAVHGTQFKDMPQYVDLLVRQGEEVPDTVSMRGTHKPAIKPLQYKYYLDQKYFDEEIEKIWKKKWQVACRAEDIPEVGDRVAYDVGPMSFLIVRSAENEFRAFWNSCRHRARQLCGQKPESGDMIQCPFHAWSFDLEGRLTWVPRWEEFPGVTPKDFSLRPVMCDTWGGNIFINPDLDAKPLLTSLGVIPSHYAECPQEDRYTETRIKKKVRINWKSGMEAFMEGYHVLTTHASGMPMFGSTYSQTDTWQDDDACVNRLITPALIPDGWVQNEVGPHVALELFCNTYGLPLPPEGRGQTIADARAYGAEMIGEMLLSTTGKDFRDRSISYLVDMHQWFAFPAHFPWWGEGLSWWYNFTPLGDSVDDCVMEIRWLRPMPQDGKPPRKAETVYIDFHQKGVDFPETGPVGYIMDEDMENMEAVHRGMKSADPTAARPAIGGSQEIRILHFQEEYKKVMGIPADD